MASFLKPAWSDIHAATVGCIYLVQHSVSFSVLLLKPVHVFILKVEFPLDSIQLGLVFF